jgi:hypothetical protein
MAYDGESNTAFENRAALPRAFLASRAVAVPTDDWSIVRLTDDRLDVRSTALLERAPPADGSPVASAERVVLDGPPVGPDERAEIVRYEPDRVVVRVGAAETRYLVLTDSYFPGWSVTVDGQPAANERANYLFRAVEIPPGEHTVEWQYRPPSLTIGGCVSLLALAVMLAMTARGLAPSPASTTEMTGPRAVPLPA